MARRPHVLAIAYHAQGHLGPLMKLSHHIAEHGIRVTFVVPEFIHDRVLAAVPEIDDKYSRVEFVSIPSGIQPGDDMSDRKKLYDVILKAMPGHFEDLIKKINLSDDEKISSVISDVGWALECAKNLGIKTALFWPSLTPGLLLGIRIPELIEAGVIDDTGVPLKDETIQLSSIELGMKTTEFIWGFPGNAARQELMFKYVFTTCRNASTCNWLLINSFYELDPLAADSILNLLSIGPLHTSKPNANLWPEDSNCIAWLDEQPARSVIYISFGSIAQLSQTQFEELALALELMDQPFLLVLRSDLIKRSSADSQDGLLQRLTTQGRGKIVEWAPQNKVLAHPSIACFLTHCGWNSTMEGLSTGVPFLCWPSFGDQFLVKSYICNLWRVGLELKAEEGGLISRNEIKKKAEELLQNGDIRTNSMNKMEMAKKSVDKGGSSLRNFNTFIEQLWL